MFFWRVILLVLVFTTLGVGILFFPHLAALGESVYAYYQGDQAFRQKAYEAADKHYRQALKAFPDPAQVYIKLGEVQQQLNHGNTALQYYQQALEFNPQAKRALVQSAHEEWRQGHHRIALRYYLDALNADPHDVQLRDTIGNRYLTLARQTNQPEDYENAASIFKKFLEKNEQDDASRYRLGETLFAQGRFTEALEVYCDLAQKHPDNPETLYSLAVTMAKNKAYPEAYQLMTQATEQIEVRQPELSERWALQTLQFQQAQSAYPQSPLPAVSKCMARLHPPETEHTTESPDS